MSHLALRIPLILLAAFMGFTALYGAFVVVPDLPRDWLDGGPFADFTIPAIALGAVGVAAVVTTLAVVIRPEVAGGIAAATGLAMMAFELVQIAVVGLSIVEYGADEPVAWLQIVYLGVGAILALLGAALWRVTTDDRARWARTGHHLVGHA